MKRTFSLALTLPFLILLVVLSLPGEKNVGIRNRMGYLLASFIPSSSKQELPPEQAQAFAVWAKGQQEDRQKMVKTAQNTLQELSFSKACIGKVIFRAPMNWSSAIWIDIGRLDNPQNGPILVAPGSPVLSGDSVIGVIDYVGDKASLVRLITDSELAPAVRVARGDIDEAETKKAIEAIHLLLSQKPLFEKEEEQKTLAALLATLLQKIETKSPRRYLAKGELQGHGQPLWKSKGAHLRGIGFNYDVADCHGPRRDLRSGEPIDPAKEYVEHKREVLIEVGDILVTSGLDGVFPEGLKIAKVVARAPLSEGAWAYDIEAEPTAGDLSELKSVIVLPPQEKIESPLYTTHH